MTLVEKRENEGFTFFSRLVSAYFPPVESILRFLVFARVGVSRDVERGKVSWFALVAATEAAERERAMKTYTWRQGHLTEGIELREVDRFGLALMLGERGRGRWEEIVTLDRRSPPVVTNGRVLDCEARTIALTARDGREARKFSVLTAAENPSSSSAIVRVSTEWVYTRGSVGRVKILHGDVQIVARGNGAHGIAGRIGSWDDLLLIVPPGGEILIRPEGGHKTTAYRLWVEADGRVDAASDVDRDRMIAVGSVT